MRWDFWNNPIVVSSFRVKYRRGGLFGMTVLYLMLLAIGGVALLYYDKIIVPNIPWPRKYLLAILAVQFALSAIIAGSTTAGSIKSEVVNRTLDFQRIAALSPRQILLGKLLGEPALAYLLAIVSFPMAFICCLNGAIPLVPLLLIYVSLFTTTLLAGTIGMVQPLETGPGKSGAATGAGWPIWIGVWIAISQGWSMLSHPWSAAALGLLTPIPAFHGIYQEAPWADGLAVFGTRIPFLFVTPISQLLLAGLYFQIMARRMVKPLHTTLSKPMAYGALIAVDIVTALVLVGPMPPPRFEPPFVARAAAFCLVHFLTCVLLTFGVTPKREALRSWVWRYRGRLPRLLDLLIGERSDTRLTLLVFCGIGAASLVLLMVLPAQLIRGDPKAVDAWPMVANALALASLLILAVGILYQLWEMHTAHGGVTVLLILGAFSAAPHVAGEYYNNDLLRSLSPSGHLANWFIDPPRDLYISPLLIGLAVVAALAAWALARQLGNLERRVDQQLAQMQVVPAR